MAIRPTDPLVHVYWEQLTPRAQRVVTANAHFIYDALRNRAWWAPQNCTMACRLWAQAFSSARVPVQELSGNYWPESEEETGLEPPLGSDHVWLVVDGFLFDPTAGQFTRPIERHFYRAA